MLTISYTLSPYLRESLEKIDDLRRNILLAVLTPRNELHLRWQAMIERIYWLLTFSDTQLSKNEIAKILSEHLKRQLTPPQLEVLAYKKGLDYIVQNWLGLQEPVSSSTVLLLYQTAFSGRLRVNQEFLKSCLLYFQSSSEHPVIQAGLIHFQILSLSPFTVDNDKLSRLLSYLFLYKEGFDCRGFLVLEEYFRRNFTDYKQLLKETARTGAQTAWLEYFAKAVQNSLEKTLSDIVKEKARMEMPSSVLKLNERQKQILEMLGNPDATITNRQAQKLFKISQITASRDLTKLASLELLFARGRGRSVYYTRV
ncbi:hypothetical protein A2960_03980 [Candidatus Gottesmanbacteria bacterium RIFCSPLOWO2_01_FULL_39_12b]|uniref:Fido domain-containing protein n=1 Tax=Candidatus Gottesmanbacteria bacterium RIFCSPLOWO2_01_FULL_39_12b TaxID=1798388 RepID=A0A1F6AN57_9BACT|nr:MAG: hypothetical protein A2960_03980 [Candidatus Gottesmanbacteria bacterium RIFCSPLOWO2_01_FULL_39_12b]